MLVLSMLSVHYLTDRPKHAITVAFNGPNGQRDDCVEATAKAASCLGLSRHKIARYRDYSGLASVGCMQAA